MAEPIVQPWGAISPPEPPPAPARDDEWTLGGGKGTAWVFTADHRPLTRPVILSDGFSLGESKVNVLYHGFERGAYPFVSELHARGFDLVILGYKQRQASIVENAVVARECIAKARDVPTRTAPLVVGGFSMGGIVTRYALAEMERDGEAHETAVYVSYDSPHRGAWIPISAQALAHFVNNPTQFREMVNSPAAKQLLQWHIGTIQEHVDASTENPARQEFLAKLGSWPQVHKIGVANGRGDGVGEDITAGAEALKILPGGLIPNKIRGTTLCTQAEGADQLVAELKRVDEDTRTVHTSGFPELDGAPGGWLDTFKLMGDVLKPSECKVPNVCFVPAVSAVAIRDIRDEADLYTNIGSLDPTESELDEFECSTENDKHTEMTAHLGGWILDRLVSKLG
jgi:hypothetical protein